MIPIGYNSFSFDVRLGRYLINDCFVIARDNADVATEHLIDGVIARIDLVCPVLRLKDFQAMPFL